MRNRSGRRPSAFLWPLCFGLFLLATFVFGPVLAATTDTVAFQSKLVNSDGTNITNGTYNFRFRIFTVASGGTVQWSEDRSISVNDGVVSTELGAVTSFPSNLFDNANLYLQVCFDANNTDTDSSDANCGSGTHRYEEVFSTRKPITAVPLALRAKYLTDSAGNSFGPNSFFRQGGNTFGATATLGTLDSNKLEFMTNSAVGMVLDEFGNIGLGTSTPRERLTIGAGGNLLADAGSIISPFGGFGPFQNLLNYSEDFSSWGLYTGSISADSQVAPNGKTTADAITINGSSNFIWQNYPATISPAADYTFSVWLKAASPVSVYIEVRDDNPGAGGGLYYKTVQVTTAWQRFSVSGSLSSAGGVGLGSYIINPGGSPVTVYAWGAQLEKASTAGSYVATGASNFSASTYGATVNGNANITGNGYIAGRLGIGTLSPQYPLDVVGQAQIINNTTTTAAFNASLFEYTTSPSANTSNRQTNLVVNAYKVGAFDSGELNAITGATYNSGAGLVGLARGIWFAGGAMSTGNISNLVLVDIQSYGTGAGEVTNATGLRIQDMGVGSSVASTVVKGIDIGASTSTVTAYKYGIYIGDQSGAYANWALYTNGSAPSRFGGNVTTESLFGFKETGGSPTYYTYFQGGNQAADITYTWPTSSTNGVLTNTAGVLSWGASGSGDITGVGSMTSGDVFADATADGDWLGLGASAGRIAFVDGTTDFVNLLDAHVGIGTVAPRAALEVVGANSSATYGSNIVSNGTFDSDVDWAGTPTDWTISGGTAAHNSGNVSLLSQTLSTSAGLYRVTFDISGLTAGMTFGVGLNYGEAENVYSDGTKIVVLRTAGNAADVLEFSPQSSFTGSIDNVSVQKITESDPMAILQNGNTIDAGNQIDFRAPRYSLYIGENAGSASTATSTYDNLGIGGNALGKQTTGSYNVAIGQAYDYGPTAGVLGSLTTGWGNVAVGSAAGIGITTGYANTFVGSWAGNELADGSYGNVFLGSCAGCALTGEVNNKLYIDNNDHLIPLVYGDFVTTRLGFGTIDPRGKLEVVGTNTYATLDGDMVINGAFDEDSSWNGTPTDWTISGGVATHNTGNVTGLNQVISTIAGLYEITFQVTGRTAGNVVVQWDFGSETYTVASNSYYSIYLRTNGNVGDGIFFTPTTDFDGSIDNVTARLVIQSSPTLVLGSDQDTLVGYQVDFRAPRYDLYIGENSGRYAQGGWGSYDNIGLGGNTLSSLVSGGGNVAIGQNYDASSTIGVLGRLTNGYMNVSIGAYSGRSLVSGNYNTFLGANSGYALTGNSEGNTLVGYSAGANLVTGINNIVIGRDINTTTTDQSYTLNIGNILFGTAIDGSGTTLSSGSIGIGTPEPMTLKPESWTLETLHNKFAVHQEQTSFAATTSTNIMNNMSLNPSASIGNSVYGNLNVVTLKSTATYGATAPITGLGSYVSNESAYDITTARGGEFSVYATGSGKFTNAIGILAFASDAANGTGGYFDTSKSAGITTAGQTKGLDVVVNNSAVTTTGTDDTYGFRASLQRTGATGGTARLYGAYVDLTTDNAGAGTSYATGLYIGLDGAADDNRAIDLEVTGNATLIYSTDVGSTSANSISLTHGGTTKTGDLINANMAWGSGSFTGDFLDFSVNSVNKFRVANTGDTTIGNSLGILESTGSTYYTYFQGGNQSADITYTLPTSSTNGVLTNTGGVLSWGTAASITIGSMTASPYFADATADDDWLGLGASAGRIAFDDQTTDYVNVLSANFGIGTTTPSSFMLQVAGNIGPDANDTYDLGSTSLRFKDLYLGGETIHIGTSLTDEATIGYTTSSNILGINTDSTSNGDIAFFTDDLYLDKSAGSVGIGTTAPGAILDIEADNTLSSGIIGKFGHTATYSTGIGITGNVVSVARNGIINDSSSASITFDAASTGTADATNTVTWSHTVANQTNRVLVVGIATNGSQHVTSVTYNGVSLTKIGERLDYEFSYDTDRLVSMWYLVAPATGAHNVVVNTSGNTLIRAGASSYYNVNQSTPIGEWNGASGSTANPTVTINSSVGEMIVDQAVWGSGSGTVGAGQTQDWNLGTTIHSASSHKAASAGTTTMSWTVSSTVHAIMAVSLKSLRTLGYSGSVVGVTTNCTVTAGLCGDNSSLLSLSQQFTGSIGTILDVTNAGSGITARFDNTNVLGNGVSIDIQSADPRQYALKVTSNNGGYSGLYVSGDGNVGINDDHPERQFSVHGSSLFWSGNSPLSTLGDSWSYNVNIQNFSTTAGNNTGLAFTVSGDPSNVGASLIFKRTGTESQGELQFYTKTSVGLGAAPVQAMVINNVQNVGIGATNNLSRLTVQQGADLTTITGNDGVNVTTTANASTTITGSANAQFNSTIGLGDRISLSSASSTYATVTAIASDTSLTVNSALGNGTSQTINVKRAAFRVDSNASASQMIINDLGNVGIGTLTPSNKFEVSSASSIVSRVINTANTSFLDLNSGAGAPSISFYTTGSVLAGNVGTNYVGTDIALWGRSGVSLVFGTNNAQVATFDTAGRFGVNTNGPDARIDSLATSGEQLRLTYTDGIDYTGFTSDASGNLTVNNTGTKTTFTDTLNTNTKLGILESTGATFYTYFQGGDQAADITYTLPTASTNGVLTNTGGVLSWGAGGSGITQVGSMTTSPAFADATADDDWLGLGAAAGRIEFDDQTVDEVNILSANVGIGTSTPGAKLNVWGTADAVQLAVRNNATQTANLAEFQTSSGTALTTITANGYIDLSGNTLPNAFNPVLKFNNDTNGATELAGGFINGFMRDSATGRLVVSFISDSSANSILSGGVKNEAYRRFWMGADGKWMVGDGTALQDTNLYRSAADQWTTDDSFVVLTNLGVGAAPTGRFNITDNTNATTSFTLTNNTANTLGVGGDITGIVDFNSTSLTTGNFVNVEANGLTTGRGINITTTGAALTSGNLIRATSAATTTSTGNLVDFSFAQTSGTGSVLGLTSTGVQTAGSILAVVGNSATTVTNGLVNIAGNGLTTGSALKVTSTGTTTLTGNLVDFSFSDTSGTGSLLALTSSGVQTAGSILKIVGDSATTVTNGLVNISGNGLTTGSALKVTSTGTTTLTGNLVDLSFADTSGSGSLLSLNSSGVQTAGSILKITGNSATTVTNGLVNIAGNALTTGSALKVTSTGTTTLTGNLVDFSFADTSGTGSLLALTSSGVQTAGSILKIVGDSATTVTNGLVNISGNGLTTGSALKVTSTGTTTLTGNLVDLSFADTSGTGSLLSLNSSGVQTAGSILKITGNSATTVTNGLVNIAGNALTTGSALKVTSTGTTTLTGNLVDFSFADTSGTGSLLALTSTGVQTAGSVLKVVADSATTTTAGIVNISGNAVTTGKLLSLNSSSAAMTGTLMDINLTGTNSANTGTLLKITSAASNTGTPLMVTNLSAGMSFRVNDETGDADTTPFMIDTSGNVGIGNTSATQKLTVTGTTGLYGAVNVGSASAGFDVTINAASVARSIYWDSANARLEGRDGTNRMVMFTTQPSTADGVFTSFSADGSSKVVQFGNAAMNIGGGGKFRLFNQPTWSIGTDPGTMSAVQTLDMSSATGAIAINPNGSAATTLTELVSVTAAINTATDVTGLYVTGSNAGAGTWKAAYFGGNVGISTLGPDARLDVLATSGEQLRLTYTDGTVYTGFTTDSSGNMTVNNSGTKTTFSDILNTNVKLGILESTGATFYTYFQGGDQAADITYTLPTASTNGVLTNTGGVLTWGAGGSGVSTVGSMTGSSVFADATADGDWLGLGAAAGRIAFVDAATDFVNIMSANVGIGTTSPGQKLTVDGTFGILEGGASPSFHTIFQGGDQSQDYTYTLPVDDGLTGQLLRTDGSGVLSWQTVSGTGTVTGVGSMTSAVPFSDATADGDWLGLGASAGRIAFTDATVDYVNIMSSYVGIGYATPTVALDIQGTTTEGTIGTEMISNVADRDFSSATGNWSGTNWSIGSGVATHTAGANTYTLANGALSAAPVASSYYQIAFTLTTTTAGTGVSIAFGGTTATMTFGKQVGTETQTVVVVAANTSALVFTPDATWTGTLDNVSIKLVTATQAAMNLRNAAGAVGLEFRAGGTSLQNVFLGIEAGQLTSSGGTLNTGIGDYALRSNTTGNNNVATGYYSLGNNTTGSYNVGNGNYTLYRNTTGSSNVAVGYSSLTYNTSGGSNVAVGVTALRFNTVGSNNIGIGFESVFTNVDGIENVGIGHDSLYSNVTGDYNIGIGLNAGYLATGDKNIFLGYNAGDNVTSGSNNIIIGSDINAAVAGNSNQLNIGNFIYGTGLSGTGDTISTAKIGLGIKDPTHAFEVNGTGLFTALGIKIITGSIDPAASTTVTGSGTQFLTEVDPGDRLVLDGTNVITGSIDPTASTAVSGVGTAFTTELKVGDQITVNSETRTVVAIASNTALTVGVAFTDTANDTTIDRIATEIRTIVSVESNTSLTVDTAYSNMGNDTTVEVSRDTLDLEGSALFKGGASFFGIDKPAAPTITPQGTTGAATWTYRISAVNSLGNETVLSANGTTTSGNATLTASNFNRITWTAVDGAYSYKIYRVASATSPVTLGLIGEVKASGTLQFDDTGVGAWAGYSSSVFDESGNINIGTSKLGPKDTLSVDGRINQSWHYVFADFFGGRANITANAVLNAGTELGFAIIGTSGCTGSYPSVQNGVFRLTTGATAALGCQINMGTAGLPNVKQYDVSYNPVIEVGLNPGASTSKTILVGLTDASTATAAEPANGVYFYCSTAGTPSDVWVATTARASAYIRNATGVTCNTNTQQRFRIEITSTSAKFYINDILVATPVSTTATTNLPAAGATLGPIISTSTTAAAAKTVDVDYIEIWQDDPDLTGVAGNLAEGFVGAFVNKYNPKLYSDTKYMKGASEEELPFGLVVSYSGVKEYDDMNTNKLVYDVNVSTASDKTVLGISSGVIDTAMGYDATLNPYAIATNGPTYAWVEEGNGSNLELGDTLSVSSVVNGYLSNEGTTKLAHAIESVDWSTVTEMVGGKKVKFIKVYVTDSAAPSVLPATAAGDFMNNPWRVIDETSIQTPYKVNAGSISAMTGEFEILKAKMLTVNDLFTVDETGAVFATAVSTQTIKGVAGGLTVAVNTDESVNIKVGDQTAIEASVKGVKVNNLVVSNQQAGKVTLSAGQTTTTVASTLAKDSSVVVVTPSKAVTTAVETHEGYFIIKVTNILSEDIQIGWYIVNVAAD